MDEVARYNKARWEDLARANIAFSRPALDLDERAARNMVDPDGLLGSVAGKDVLCLASGGGQQSAAFSLLGARVTVLDIAETQLERDRTAAAHYGFSIRTEQGDMRDLSRFAAGAFDLVWQAHSINFVPDARRVFGEVAHVLREGGQYRVAFHNPYVIGIDERDWNGSAYPLSRPYVDSEEVDYAGGIWEVWDEQGSCTSIRGPKEFRHVLATIVNGLIERGFIIRKLWEDLAEQPNPAPGTWDHFKMIAPAGFVLWCTYRPDVLLHERLLGRDER